jgi:8-oxo-dGTP diphosphatase
MPHRNFAKRDDRGFQRMAGKTIHAAGGIVVRRGARPLIAVVQRAKDERWVLPRGKLKRRESPLAGARREVVEETGHSVRVRAFLGALTYRARGRPKVVQFWHMQASARPTRDLMKDIMAVEWLPLSAAVRRLSYPLEKLFLRNVGRATSRSRRRPRRKTRHISKTKVRRHAAKTNGSKSRRRRLTASRERARKPAGHSSVRSARSNILRRVLGRLTP